MLLTPPSVAAIDTQEYDARLCSAELIVMQGDLRQFLLKTSSIKHRNGYQQRMAGALGTLKWLCRRYAALYGLSTKKTTGKIDELLDAFSLKNWNKVNRLLENLSVEMPLSLKGLKPQEAKAEFIQTGKEIYTDYCQACHKQPDLNQARPAYSLFKMANKLSQKEFIARMIVGVHGTPEIALQNPLTKDDIAGMFAYLLRENK